MGDNREFDVSGIFRGVLLIIGGGELMTIEDPSVGDNREFDVSSIF